MNLKSVKEKGLRWDEGAWNQLNEFVEWEEGARFAPLKSERISLNEVPVVSMHWIGGTYCRQLSLDEGDEVKWSKGVTTNLKKKNR